MIAAILIGTFVLMWKFTKFAARWLFTALYYVAVFMVAIVVCGLTFMLNVVTVPVLIAVYVFQKCRGGQRPYVGSWLVMLYPTFTDPEVAAERRKMRKQQAVKVVCYDWLTDPLYWAY